MHLPLLSVHVTTNNAPVHVVNVVQLPEHKTAASFDEMSLRRFRLIITK